MSNSDMDKLRNAEFKEAFDEFDKVERCIKNVSRHSLSRMVAAPYPQKSCLGL